MGRPTAAQIHTQSIYEQPKRDRFRGALTASDTQDNCLGPRKRTGCGTGELAGERLGREKCFEKVVKEGLCPRVTRSGAKEWGVAEEGIAVQELRGRWLKLAVVSYQITFRLTKTQNIQI